MNIPKIKNAFVILCLCLFMAAVSAPAQEAEEADTIRITKPAQESAAGPFIITANNDWAPYAHSVEIAPGGVFDFSHLLDAPAGKHGALRATPAGHFEFEKRPGVRVRFWGVNLLFTANFLARAEADRLAERLARSGYNSVRLHFFDADLVRPSLTKGGDSWDLDPAMLDKLDYLFAALKKRGIYLNIDLFCVRGFSAREMADFGFGPVDKFVMDPFKGLIPVSESAFQSWSRFAENLLTHHNPHTGLTWAADPALIGICPVNEDALQNRIGHPVVLELHKKAFVSANAGPADEAGKRSSPAWNRFIYESQIRSDIRLFAFLRSLGTKALLTGANYGWTEGLSFVRDAYDYVDNHQYWDHPKFPGKAWQPPFAFNQKSAVAQKAALPRELMPTRLLGRPFTVTEFNFCRPNQYRSELAVLMPAYASLQDWDALYNNQYASTREMVLEGGIENYFALATDPIGLTGSRVGCLIFQRGDIAPALRTIAWASRPSEAYRELWRRVPASFSPLGLVSRIGSVVGEPEQISKQNQATGLHLAAVVASDSSSTLGKVPDGVYLAGDDLAARLQRNGALPAGSISDDETKFTSDTGQIQLDTTGGTIRVVTPRSELFLVAAEGRMQGDRVAVANGQTRAAVSVIALEPAGDKEFSLANARRILVTHLTDALPEGMEFADDSRKLLKSWGKGPHLLLRGEATLTLRLPEGNWKAWAVDATGARVREVELTGSGDTRTLHIATVTAAGTQLAYELAR